MAEGDDRSEKDVTKELLAWMAEACRLVPDKSRAAVASSMPVHDPSEGIAYRERPLDRGAILALVVNLVRLEHFTNPAVTAHPFMELYTSQVLENAGTLLSYTIRWAVMHEAGCALSNAPVTAIPGSTANPTALERAGKHAHELAGASWHET